MAMRNAQRSLANRFSRRARQLVSAVVVIVLLAVLHRPILREFSRCLVISGKIHTADDIVPWSGDHVYDFAADLFQQDPTRRVLMVDWKPDRLEQNGFVKTKQFQFQQELTARGVSGSAIEVIPGRASDDWEAARCLRLWLKNDPQKTVVILCDEFQSRQLFLKLRRILGPEAERVRLHALPDRRYGTKNWWQSRTGARACAFAWIGLVDTWCRGIPAEFADRPWNSDEYEGQLQHAIQHPGDRLTRAQFPGWLPAMAEWLDIGEPPSKVDHVLLLPGDQAVRPFVAAALIKAGLANDVIVPQNFPSPQELDGITEPVHEVIRKILHARGVPDHKIIILPGRSDKTVDDAQVAAEFLKSTPESRIAVVTSFYHTRRARIAFHYVYSGESNRFIFVSAPTDKFGPGNWWKSETGTFIIAAEWTKLGLYWIRYGDGLYWIFAGFSVCAGFAVVLSRLIRRCRRKRGTSGEGAQTVQSGISAVGSTEISVIPLNSENY